MNQRTRPAFWMEERERTYRKHTSGIRPADFDQVRSHGEAERVYEEHGEKRKSCEQSEHCNLLDRLEHLFFQPVIEPGKRKKLSLRTYVSRVNFYRTNLGLLFDFVVLGTERDNRLDVLKDVQGYHSGRCVTLSLPNQVILETLDDHHPVKE